MAVGTLSRLAMLLVALLAVVVAMALLPGNGVRALLGRDATEADVAAHIQRLGLDRPLVERFTDWFAGLLHGDFGQTLRGESVNALLATSGGATWVSLHHGGGVGMGFSQHSGVVIVCDGTEQADRRLARVLWNDPATGVMRHADAGYEQALACAREHGLTLPAILE